MKLTSGILEFGFRVHNDPSDPLLQLIGVLLNVCDGTSDTMTWQLWPNVVEFVFTCDRTSRMPRLSAVHHDMHTPREAREAFEIVNNLPHAGPRLQQRPGCLSHLLEHCTRSGFTVRCLPEQNKHCLDRLSKHHSFKPF